VDAVVVGVGFVGVVVVGVVVVGAVVVELACGFDDEHATTTRTQLRTAASRRIRGA
jgi:hypothetical protein